MKRVVQGIVSLILALCLAVPGMALDGVWHDPYGMDDLYEIQPAERYPRDPAEGETVYIRGNTWPVEMGQSVRITYEKNGAAQPDVQAQWKYNQGNNSYWEAAVGPFEKGDEIEYYVRAVHNGGNEKTVGPFRFVVAGWETVKSVSLGSSGEGTVVLNAAASAGNFAPKIGLSFPTADTLRVQLSPKGEAAFEGGAAKYTVDETAEQIVISTDKLRVTVTKSPYGLSIYDLARQKELTSSGSGLGWLTDGSNGVTSVMDTCMSPEQEQFFGFGERYNGLAQRGNIVNTYVYNQYQNQGDKTYLAVPFFYSSRGYGLYLNTTCYSQFDMASTQKDRYTFRANTDGSGSALMDYYVFAGPASEVLGRYTEISGKPQQIPKWAFGLWMSANEWDRQSEVLDVMDKAKVCGIPATVLVLEQWSDENTFYIFNDSTYTPTDGAQALRYEDFSFGEKWPDPRAMSQAVHDQGMKLLLWQVPVLKHTDYSWAQKDNDEAHMIAQGYAVGDGKGGQYRTPTGTWFGDSLLLDFTNQKAVEWWMSKRAYLFDSVGIDGFKTDGGEMVWGRNVSFSDGTTGVQMRNAYPNAYIKAYNDFSKQKTGTGMTFSRAGTSGVQTAGAFWAGDQTSSFSAFWDALGAGLSAGVSGIPFWGWDLAGFTGPFPTAELYKRSTMMAAFSPIMQFHSEKADPAPSEERSPWNVQARTGDGTVVDHFKYYVNTRMNILPYIYSEAQRCTKDGTPLMRAMFLDFPEDARAYEQDEQYMFGRNLLVAPVVHEGQTVKEVYLPDGEWIDLYHNALTPGGETKSYYCPVDSIAVYVRNGAILPMNFNGDYELGGEIGNDVERYENLTFRIYPQGSSSYTLHHADGTTMEVSCREDFASERVTADVAASDVPVTLQVFGTKPDSVSVNDQPLAEVDSVAALAAAESGYYYSQEEKLTYVKLCARAAECKVILSGISKAPVEAEHAALQNVTTNTDHTGYSGEGFVDGFAEAGDAVSFSVWASREGKAELHIRYCAGTESAQRTVIVNGVPAKISLPKTENWDTWNEVTVPAELHAGRNTVQISFESGDYAGINLDCISVK